MTTTNTAGNYPFLADGGEMGERTRTYNWSATPLGTPDQWPQSLKTTVGLLLHSAFPMFLFWGPDLLCFYNDAYRVSLGDNGKHPAVGKPGADVWPEIWDFIGPMIEEVMRSGKPTFFEDQLLPIYRNGRLEDVYWTFSYSPAYGDDNRIAGVFVTCTETTQKVATIGQLQLSEQRFQNLIREASVGIIVLEGEEMRVRIVNHAYADLIGHRPDELTDRLLFSVIPEAEPVFRPIIDGVRLTGESLYLYAQPYFVQVNGVRKDGFLNLVYQPYKEPDGQITGVMVLCQDVTQQVSARQKVEESEARFRSLIEESPVATCLFMGPDLVIDVANERMIRFFGRGPTIVGKPVREVLTGHTGDEAAIALLTQAFTTGEPFSAAAAPAQLTIDDQPGTYYFDLNLEPLRNAAGAVYAVLETAVDVTEQVLSRQKVDESEARFRSLIEEAPVATCLFVGRKLTIEIANGAMISVWGKGPSVLGMPLSAALPELEGQPFLPLLDELFETGNDHQTKAGRADLIVDGELKTYYFDYNFKPLRNKTGAVYAIMEMAIDVTEEVLARQKLEEAESGLRVAVEMAELATWSINVTTNGLSYSERLVEWYGFDPKEQDYSVVIPVLDAGDRERVASAVAWALNPESNGIFNEVYTAIHPQTGKKRILHAQGKVICDATGKAVRLNGTAQDITAQRELQLALEEQIRERTEELAAANTQLQAANSELEAANEELKVSNEETIAINADLSESNSSLIRSNENLEKFAYVASHDLQEPLRKVQQFGDLLINQYGSELGEGIDYLQRMQSAANRMSTLIRDLLTFSRISTQPNEVTPVSLNVVLNSVLSDLDLRIQENGAVVKLDPLPIVQGDRSQLEQLFLNLLSNSLKFHRAEVSPVVEVSSQLVVYSDLPPSVKPTRQVGLYHRIDVADNGIGFDEKYLDRIFQVFQRLTGKNQYAGTGIGLAICEKVAANHGGAITATSQPGQGATFSVYFPA